MTPAAWKNSQGKAGLRSALAPAGTLPFGQVTQVRVCSSQTRNLSLSFLSCSSQLVVFKSP